MPASAATVALRLGAEGVSGAPPADADDVDTAEADADDGDEASTEEAWTEDELPTEFERLDADGLVDLVLVAVASEAVCDCGETEIVVEPVAAGELELVEVTELAAEPDGAADPADAELPA